jgi:hypothetical protein
VVTLLSTQNLFDSNFPEAAFSGADIARFFDDLDETQQAIGMHVAQPTAMTDHGSSLTVQRFPEAS